MATDLAVREYKFDELPTEQAKDKARQVLTGAFDEDFSEMVWEDVQYSLKTDIEQFHGLNGFELYYEFGFSQGDGVGFGGSMDALEIGNPEAGNTSWLPILAMLGANRERHNVGGKTVSWARPIIGMTVEIDNGRNCAFFTDSMLTLDVVYGAQGEDGFHDEDQLADDHPIFQAVAKWFRDLTRKLYNEYSSMILNAAEDDDCVEQFLQYHQEVRFNVHGDRIDELDDTERTELEEDHARDT